MRDALQHALPVDAVTLLLSMLAVVAQLLVLGALVLWVGARGGSGAFQRAHSGLMGVLRPQAVALAFVVALTATLGSLYLSEIAMYPPCRMCWYQRIAMYPLALMLGVALVRRVPASAVRALLLPATIVGSLLSIYHYQLERFPQQEHLVACDVTNPCTITWVWRFHYISIPMLALTAFALITMLLLTTRCEQDTTTTLEEEH